MQCPHCLEHFAAQAGFDYLGHDPDGYWWIASYTCENTSCKRLIVQLVEGEPYPTSFQAPRKAQSVYAVRPRATTRPPLSPHVPEKYAALYRQSATVLTDSPEASAALSRRCLQMLLEDVGGATERDLSKQIDQVEATGLPSYVSRSLDRVREIGNFGAHPIKSTASGEILPVEPGEAEWNLDALDSLFDFYFVQPARETERTAAINAKLREAGRRELT